MSERNRWRDEGPEDVRALLRHGAKTSAMSATDRARMRVRVVRVAGAVGAVGAITWLQGAAFGAGLGVLVLGAVHFAPAAWVYVSAPAQPSPVVPRAPVRGEPSIPALQDSAAAKAAASDDAVAPSAEASTESLRGPLPAKLPSAPTPPSEEVSTPAPLPSDSLAEEALLLEHARASLASSPVEALRLTEEHASRFPQGKLSMEREFVAIDALRRLGRVSEARARAEKLLSAGKGGLYGERLQKLVEELH